MTLTDYQRAVLAHIVVDVDAWVSHAIDTVGEEAVNLKIAKWEQEYLSAKESLGENYKTRAEREAFLATLI